MKIKIVFTLLLTTTLLLITILLGGGGHGTYLPAKIFYPFTMIIAVCQNKIGVFALILAIIQIPIYSLLLSKKPKWKYYLIAIHIIAIIFILNMNNNTF